MPTDGGVSGYDVRIEAREALKGGCLESVKGAFTALAGAVGIATAAGGGLAVLNKFDLRVFLVLAYLAVLSWPVAFAILELARLRNHSRLLRAVLTSENYYESLLADARRERDDMKRSLTESEVRIQAVTAARDLIGVLESRVRRELAPDNAKETEHA
jgi:hypothetical protein